MDCSRPGFPLHHQLPNLDQIQMCCFCLEYFLGGVRYQILSYMPDCVFIIFIAIDEQCLVPLTPWGLWVFISKAIQVHFTHLRTQGFCFSPFPFCLYNYLTEKQIYIYPLTNFSNNRLRPARQLWHVGRPHYYCIYQNFLKLIMNSYN